MRYQTYNEYKSSGHPWVGKIPSHWRFKQLKYMANCFPSNVDKKTKEGEQLVLLCNYTDVYYNEEITPELDFMRASATDEQVKKFALMMDDVIITKDSEDPNDIAVPTVVKENLEGVICGYHLSMVRANKDNSGRFLKRVFDSKYARSVFATTCNGLTRYGLGSYAIANALFPYPPLAEQSHIAAFLDHETAKIDTLIDKQQQLIKLLQEKRQAVISHAVTKGLNPSVKMKDSGVEWLGEVPEHWRFTRIKYSLTMFEQGWSPQCENTEAENDEIGVMKVGCVNGGIFKSHQNKTLPKSLTPLMQYALKRGDLLISRANTKELVGSAAVVNSDYSNLLLCDKLYRLRFFNDIDPQFVSYFLSAPQSRQVVELAASGASDSMQNIGQSTIKNMNIAFPPCNEMKDICTYLASHGSKIDLLVQKCQNQITLLMERRTALISAAVTGKIDVRNAA